MSTFPQGSFSSRPRRPPRRRRGRRVFLVVVSLVLLAGVFALGVALGEALHDNPDPRGTKTQTRQLRPVPLPPETRTVTVRKR